MQERDSFLYKVTFEFGVSLSLLHLVFFLAFGIDNIGVYLLAILWCFASSYGLAWFYWVALERPRLERARKKRE
jgi:peptidoglycan/LPS O-acetylase OafA/YrhL